MNQEIRSLGAIADSIHSLQRGNIIEVGDLLLEAKAQCEHGQWLDWLFSEFEWSIDTAQRYMKVAELCAKYRSVRNLKLAPTTLYELARRHDDDMPSIIDELVKHATQTRVSPADARHMIMIGSGRRRFGDLPNAALLKLAELDRSSCDTEEWYPRVVAALQQQRPTTDEDVDLIVAAERERFADETEQEAEEALSLILDGPPPYLPPPAIPPEPQSWGATTAWPETDLFASAVKDLLELRAKPVRRFSGVFSSADLREVSAFLISVAAADERQAA